MANLPATLAERSTQPDPWVDKIADLIRHGWTSGEIARKMHPKNPRKQKVLRGRIRRTIALHAELAGQAAMESHGIAIEALPEMTEALVSRAKRGRTDSIKLAYELTKFHNPRITHDHTGEIKIKLEGLTRPERTVDSTAASLEDAQVVEDPAPGKEVTG